MKTQNTKHWLIFSLFFVIFSCIPQEEQGINGLVEKTIEENGFKLSSINPSKSAGLRIKNLEELDLVLKAIKGKNASEYGLQDILVRNGITELPSVGFNSLEVYKNDIIPHSSQGKIQCIQNWRNVYGRIGISGGFGPTYIDFGFTIGDGSGLIVNWNSTLEGNTFMISLGKNDFRNGGYA